MRIGKRFAAVSLAAGVALAMTACTGGGGTSTTTTTAAPPPATSSSAPAPTTTAAPPTSSAPAVALTMSGWSLKTTPEFQKLVDGFKAKEPNVTITIKEYDPNQYEQLLLTDMTAKTAPDIIAIKQAKYTYQWAMGGQLMDISDMIKALPSSVNGAGSYVVGGKNFGMPYRQDSWLLFYDKDLFDKAGVAVPNGQWTWDDYVKTAKELTTKLKAAGVDAKGTYQHSWQSTTQGLANAQAGDTANASGPFFSGDYSYMLPYYQRALDLQTSGAQELRGNITTNKLTYQAMFGKQSAAMMIMGSWYIATLRSQQASGDANAFTWGIAPVPQVDSSTFAMPVTFGDPTGMGINANIDGAKLAAAKDFLNYISSQDAAVALAGIGITPAMSADAVTQAVFAAQGMPSDPLSKTAYQTHKTFPENPSGADTMNIQTILGQADTAIMTGSTDPKAALDDAGTKVKNKDW